MKFKQNVSFSEKKLGAYNIRWATGSGEFKATRTIPAIYDKFGNVVKPETVYGKLRFGNQYYEVTQKVGEYMIQTYKQGIADVNTKQSMKQVNQFFNQMLGKEYGTTGVLFENITKAGGMEEVFRARLKGQLDPEMKHMFDNLVDVLNEINKDRIKAQNFYDEVAQQFSIIGNKYEKMQSQGGRLSESDIEEMRANLKSILEIALDYVEY